MVDLVEWRAYSAEHSLDPQTPLPSMAAVVDFVATVTTSTTWLDMVQHSHEITVVEADFEGHESYLLRNRPWVFTSGELAVHREMRWTLNLLHELAHGAAPHFRHQVDGDSNGGPPAHAELHPHDHEWASTYVRLVEEFAPDWAPQLREAYEHYGVSLLDEAALARAHRDSRLAEEEWVAWEEQASLEDRFSLMMNGIPQVAATRRWAASRTPLSHCLLELTRGEEGALDELATRIASIVPCTPQDLGDLIAPATSDEAHLEDRHPRIAMAALVALDVDPIFMRTDLGLTRWSVGLEVDELMELGPDWWARVERLNGQMAERPSRWNLGHQWSAN